MSGRNVRDEGIGRWHRREVFSCGCSGNIISAEGGHGWEGRRGYAMCVVGVHLLPIPFVRRVDP
jgi:hypothetical protein